MAGCPAEAARIGLAPGAGGQAGIAATDIWEIVMENKASHIVWSLGAVLIVAAICAAGTYSCTQVNERYYEGMKHCLDQGGSWVPQSSGSYSSSCINPHSRQEDHP